jgi:pimeloyl-ACP methyl ester carboxylesterase
VLENSLRNLRIYGEPPYSIAVIHGGPGAPGDLAPIARELSTKWGVLEPLQTKDFLEGQVLELKEVLETKANLPIILIGHSWGAFLSFILAGRYPQLVKKLILVASGPYETHYANNLMEKRLEKLSDDERAYLFSTMKELENPKLLNKDELFSRVGKLLSKADSYNQVEHDSEIIAFQFEINSKVWTEASKLRSSGNLLALGKNIKCPVVAIHGDYDSHPAEGVEKPLTRILSDFNFYLLEKCGHFPWLEIEARLNFYKILRSQLM